MSEHPETWSVSKIKQVLDQHKIDHRGCTEKEELLDLLHKIPEFAQWKTPHHAEAYETSAHVAAPHYFDDNVQSGSSTQAPPTQQAAPPKQEHHEPKAQPQQAAPAAAPQTGEHPETWGASKIKQVLDQHKIDHRGCMEKEELLELLHKIPEYKNFVVPHHPDSHEQTSHVESGVHFFDGK